MITSYKGITKKYLKENKKRALLTIVGIILSVALISSIGLFFKAMQESQIEGIKGTIGSYHLKFTDPDQTLVEKIRNNPKVSKTGMYAVGEEFILGDTINTKEMITNGDALDLLPSNVKRGRYPEEKNEVAVDSWLLKYIEPDADVGGMIDINGKKYRLVGILEDNVANQMSLSGTLVVNKDIEEDAEKFLLIRINEKANLRKTVDELSELAPEKVEQNPYLISIEGGGDFKEMAGIYLVLAVIIGVVLISTIAVIYNSFQISVVQRIKEFGLLRAVGTTPKQIRKIVLREATLLSIIGIPIGLLFGVLAIYSIDFAFNIIGSDDLQIISPVLSPLILIGSAVLGAISIYISALLPARFAGKISPLLAISNRKSIKKEKIKRRRGLSRIFRLILGFEGELAYKNIRRNRKRYRITVFSIVISVVLFISFSSFVDISSAVTESPNESDNIHLTINRDVPGGERINYIRKYMLKEIKDIAEIKTAYKSYEKYDFDMLIDKESEVKKVREISDENEKSRFIEIYKESENEDKIKMMATINVYDDKALEVSKDYLKSGDIDIEKMNENNGVIFVGQNRIYNAETENFYYGPIADIKKNDGIKVIRRSYWDEEKNIEITNDLNEKLNVVAVADQDVFEFRGNQDGLKLITTKEVAEKLLNKEEIKPIGVKIILNSVDDEEKVITKLENIIKDRPNLRIINHIDMNRQAKSAKLMLQILLYGFVIVVSLIGAVNIINTLTTNILLRKREFATLRSIGLTHKGLKRMIVLEGMLYGLTGLVYGSVIGSLLSYVMVRGMGSIREMEYWSIPWNTLSIAALAVILIGILSVQYPLSKIKNDNLIETIKGDY